VGKATVRVLEAAGFTVRLVHRRVCCGRPFISKGQLESAREQAQRNVELLAPYAERGVPIVGCEPSCILTFRDEYLDLLDDPRAQQVAQQSYLIEEFLVKLSEEGKLNLRFRETPDKVLVHGHCHQKAQVGSAPMMKLLRLAGCEASEVDSGCCGMAGSFGFEAEHYDVSMQIGGLRLFPAVNAAGVEVTICAPGVSCRQQIEHATGRPVKHPIEVVAERLEG
jgi:Fe-S oxidoreductase